MGSLTPGPEDTKKQNCGSRYLPGTTHGLKTIRADTPARGAEDSRNGVVGDVRDRPRPPHVLAGLSRRLYPAWRHADLATAASTKAVQTWRWSSDLRRASASFGLPRRPVVDSPGPAKPP